MKKISKTLSLGMILVFILMIFNPYSVLADAVSVPSLSTDNSRNYIASSVTDLNLNPENVEKIPVDIQITAADKTYNPNITLDENFKTTVTGVKVVAKSDKDSDLINKYNVKASYDGDVKLNGPTIGDVPLIIDKSKLKITYDSNDDYGFILDKVLPASVNVFDDGSPAPTVEEQKQQVNNAKKAQDILYNKLEIGKGDVPEFFWGGYPAKNPGEEGTIEISDYAWEVFSSARSGYTGVRSGFYDDWFKDIQNGLQLMKDAGVTARDVKMTEWEKLVLAITAIGYDPRDIKAYDLIDIISNKAYVETSKQYFSSQYAIYALTSYNYIDSVPQDGKHIDRNFIDEHMHTWAENELESKGENSISDMVIMQFQPIAAYYNPNAKEEDKYYYVKQAMDHAFDKFSNAQTCKGFFWGGSGYIDNPWTNAQVHMTLGMAKVNIFDKKYIKCGKTILNSLLKNFDFEKGTTIFHKHDYEPGQIGRGLNSLVRAYEGGNSIFDCTDVKDSTVPVNNAIDALPNNITPAHKEQVEKTWALYSNLSDAKKASIKESRVSKLDAARKSVYNPTPEDKTLEITNLTDQKEFKLGDTAKISVKAENNSGKDHDMSLIVALYDKSNKFIKYVSGKKTIKNGQSSILNGMVKLPKEGIYKLKAFVWDSLENMTPLSNVIDIPVESNK